MYVLRSGPQPTRAGIVETDPNPALFFYCVRGAIYRKFIAEKPELDAGPGLPLARRDRIGRLFFFPSSQQLHSVSQWGAATCSAGGGGGGNVL